MLWTMLQHILLTHDVGHLIVFFRQCQRLDVTIVFNNHLVAQPRNQANQTRKTRMYSLFSF